MLNILEERAIKFANYIIENRATVRKTANIFNVSKSTVHNDVTKRLKVVNYALYVQTSKVLKENFALKHIHGGEATKLKYMAENKLK